jgi:hypothetical protein
MINRKVAGIRLDGNNFTDLKVFFKVFERWQIRGRALYFPWPESDLATICAEDSNAVPHLQKLRALWEVVIAGNQNVEAPKESYEFASESIPEVTESEGATGIGQSARLKTRKGAIVFEEKDSIDPPDASESLLPLPPLPPIDNEAVVKQFDMEFPLESLIEQFNCA